MKANGSVEQSRSEEAMEALLYPPESQRAVLGCILLDNRYLTETCADLTVEHFSGTLHQEIFRKALELHQDGQPFDALLLGEVLKNAGHFENGDGAIYLESLSDGVVLDPDRIKWHVQRIIELASLRRLNRLCENLLHESRQLTVNPLRTIQKFIGQVQRR
jgi:replicative DNA helicase